MLGHTYLPFLHDRWLGLGVKSVQRQVPVYSHGTGCAWCLSWVCGCYCTSLTVSCLLLCRHQIPQESSSLSLLCWCCCWLGVEVSISMRGWGHLLSSTPLSSKYLFGYQLRLARPNLLSWSLVRICSGVCSGLVGFLSHTNCWITFGSCWANKDLSHCFSVVTESPPLG